MVIKIALICALTISIALCCPGDKYCRICESKQCYLCEYSFLKDNVCVSPNKTISNCITYKEDGSCDDCDLSYGLGKDGKCFKCKATGCATCDQDDQCNSCYKNIVPVNGKCEVKTPCADDCNVCLATGKCFICNKGFLLDGTYKCVKAKVSNCMASDDNKTCKACASHYYVANNGSCSRRGSNWFMIILIILVIALVAGVAFYFIKKRRESGSYGDNLVTLA